MRFNLSLIFAIGLIISLFSACENQKPQKSTVVILHTNDEHARLGNFARLAYLKDSLEKKFDHVLLVSAGDRYSGNPYVDMHPEKGKPIVEIMNKTGYDLTALGNHEFDYGQEVMQKRLSETNFPMICANAYFEKTKIKSVSPYHIIRFGEIEIGFLGLIQLNSRGLPSSAPANMENCEFRPGFDVVKEYLMLEDSTDVLVCLSHMGYDKDIELAQNHDEFDIVIGGHSHTKIDSLTIVNKSLIAQTGNYVKNVGMITLEFLGDSLLSRDYDLIAMNEIDKQDPEIVALIEKYSKNEILDEEIAHLEIPLEGPHQLGNVYTDAVKSEGGFDIAFQNRGAIRVSGFAQGALKLADIYKLDPFSNDVILHELTVPQIESLLAYSYNIEKQIDLQVSGIKYSITIDSENEIDNIQLYDYNNKPLDRNKIFKVAISSYVSDVYKFEHSKKGTPIGKTTTELLISYLKKQKTITKVDKPRIELLYVE